MELVTDQGENVFARVRGEPYVALPKDLYIPPDALEVVLEAFEGPLDLLLYLIRRQNLDILEIPIALITEQYIQYIEMMSELRLELAAEYLVMASMLAEIKSRMLLPRPSGMDDDQEDPRMELVRRLQKYERYKQAAEDIDQLPRLHRDVFQVEGHFDNSDAKQPLPDVDLREMLMALREVLHRADLFSSHRIEMEPLSVRERMSMVLDRLGGKDFVPFPELFEVTEGRMGVVVTFLALLELIKSALIELVQAEAYSTIHIRAAAD